jgi:hypothetical protein
VAAGEFESRAAFLREGGPVLPGMRCVISAIENQDFSGHGYDYRDECVFLERMRALSKV